MTINSLKDLKAARAGQLDRLKKMADTSTAQGSNSKDERIWSPHWDKDKKTGYAVVRLLPSAPGDDYPWVKLFKHSFKGPTGKWYIENSLTTIGQTDPLSELNSRLWNSGIESDKDVAREQKRKTTFYANVLVLEDPANPEAVGQVKIFRFGQKIFEMITAAMNPEFADETPLDPFDPWAGADFVIKMREESGYPNYNKSYFKESSALSEDDAEIEKIWKRAHKLSEFLDVAKNFKTYDELKKRLVEVLGPEVGSGVPTIEGAAPVSRAPSRAAPAAGKAKAAPAAEEDDNPFEDDVKTAEKSVESSTTAAEDDMEAFLKDL